jgi:phosphatidylglycerol---prolipoprotein diacylglyceryl transferase
VSLHFPFFLQFGEFRLHPHFVFESLAYTMGFLLYRRLRARYGDAIPAGTRWSVTVAAIFGAAVGSKLLFLLEQPALTIANIRDAGYLLGGKTIVGGLIGATLCVELAKWVVGEHRRTGDLFAVPLCFGIAIGRVGCFLTGLSDQTCGSATTLPWGVDFGDGVTRHPTQLYELLFVLVLGIYLWSEMGRPHAEGLLFRQFIVGYMGFRLLVDFIKPDSRYFGLSSIQWACVAVLVWYGFQFRRTPGKRTGSEGVAQVART